MPLLDEAVTLTGGCNCGAIRYRIAVPPKAERPFTPLVGDDITETTPCMPYILSCYCNDCRRAIGATRASLPCIAYPDYIVTVSVLPRDADECASRACLGRWAANTPRTNGMRPEREMNVEFGLPWARAISAKGTSDIIRHGTSSLREMMSPEEVKTLSRSSGDHI